MLRGSRRESEAWLRKRTAGLTEVNAELQRQIAERKRVEEALRKNNTVVQLLLGTATASNEALNFEEAMRRCFELIHTHVGWPMGHAYISAEGPGKGLTSTGIWHVDTPERFSVFRKATEDTHFVPEVGLPGLVVDSGKPVWIPDVSDESDLPRFEQAVVDGVRAGFAFPVLVQNEVAAVVELFTTEVLEPDEQLLEILLRVGAQLGWVIERERARERHNLLNQELESRNLELDQKNKEIEAFVYSVSHDLRSPLVNLEGFSQELGYVGEDIRELFESEDLSPDIRRRGLALVDEDMETSIRFIRAGVKRLSNIIDALLRLSRAGRVEYRWQWVDLGPIVERILDAMKDTIAESGADVRVGDLPPAWGDPTQLEQVFANLICNALNYLDAGRPGLVRVGCKETEAATDGVSDPGIRTYYVEDNGVGIPQQASEKIFQVFQRLHPDKAAGEGMGLALVQRVVERHDGKVWVESIDGEGSTFFVRLPSGREGRRG